MIWSWEQRKDTSFDEEKQKSAQHTLFLPQNSRILLQWVSKFHNNKTNNARRNYIVGLRTLLQCYGNSSLLESGCIRLKQENSEELLSLPGMNYQL